MTHRFRQRIRKALANDDLQTALDRYVHHVRPNKTAGYESLTDDLQSLRKRANAVRSDTITNLGEHLAQFCQHARANGMIIHKAQDAAAACRIAVEIAERHDARIVVKSKSMVTEEIGLNHALETAGMEVIETDLGEYIIQLRGEGPSHITAPAIHLKREQVGETFHEKLGMPYTADVSIMTETARKELRQTFLEADLGISGVNFGVAESGSLCIITNEGNGRMVTTLPRTHIAIMGIERLVPTFKDLALMLNLLPRSATGQKITVYTSIINGPRKEVDEDGPEERHIILVDNGRETLRNTPLQDALYCIRCGACLDYCPIFKKLSGLTYTSLRGDHTPYPGPIGSIVSPGLFGQRQFGHLAQVSTLCGLCQDVCPVSIDLPSLLTRVRAGGAEERKQAGKVPDGVPKSLSLALRLYTWFAADASRFSLAQRILVRLSRFHSPKDDWMRLPAITGWGKNRRLPRPTEETFRTRWGRRLQANNRTPAHPDPSSPRVPQSEMDDSTELQANANEEPPRSHSDTGEIIIRFEQEVKTLGGTFTRCQQGQLPTRIIQFLRDNEVRKLLAWEKDQLPSGLCEAVQDAGVELVHGAEPSVKFGLTGADVGIAETGSFMVTSGSGRALTTSLLPEVHIAVIHARDVLPNLKRALTLPKLREASAAAVISGPSRTADIEMILALGVHGPKKLHIFCVMDA